MPPTGQWDPRRVYKKIIRKHWHLLGNDRIINTFLPVAPQVIFRGVPSLGDRVAPNVVDPPPKKVSSFQKISGYHQCRRCQVCTLNKIRSKKTELFISTSTLREHKIESFSTCSSTGIVYLLQCPWGLQYIGRTKRSMQVRLGEHITNIKSGFKDHSVSRHYDLHHKRNPANTLFLWISRYNAHWRGGSLVRELSRMEMSWIHRVRCYTPYGLNIDIDVNAFIDNS